ncbi:hypothetical protein RHECNPAF_1330081 [Rhizobium etli CNPAF512]|nr:hypothetical protein RHECNPAF_1330081 [Rhizobium etli CNPAF512]
MRGLWSGYARSWIPNDGDDYIKPFRARQINCAIVRLAAQNDYLVASICEGNALAQWPAGKGHGEPEPLQGECLLNAKAEGPAILRVTCVILLIAYHRSEI